MPQEEQTTMVREDRYDAQRIETKWFERWQQDASLYAAEPNTTKPKYYALEMLPYPSGVLHMGHVRNYAIGDALARFMWMNGYNVLHPMGWDSFGLPAENAAISNNTPPREWTQGNIAAMKRQMRRIGFSYDWATEITTCLPDYYRWNQWFFLRMLEKGLVYRKKSKVNWCPECATVLANEQVVDGCCWRHEDTKVEQRDLEQWFLRITAYAQELLDGLYGLTPKFIPYLLSFLVLGLRWLSNVQVRSKAEQVGRGYFRWWLVYLLLVTCVPFSTLVVGRFPNLAPAIWLYAGNTALIALASFGLLAELPQVERDDHLRDRQVSIVLLLATSLLTIAWSFVNPRQALLALALNAAAPMASPALPCRASG